MRCAILQPSYIPWRGYFHQIAKSDVFVFYDDVQYDKRGWRNRNRMKSPTGFQWLTIPVHSAGVQSGHIPINQVAINWAQSWNRTHWLTLRTCYAKAPYFEAYESLLASIYSQRPTLLADFTIDFTIRLARTIGIEHTKFIRSSSINVEGDKTDRLIQILQNLDATHYISGPSARDYLEEDKLHAKNISLEYMLYDYPEYEQLYPPFDGHVSILDLMFMRGPEAGRYIWGDI